MNHALRKVATSLVFICVVAFAARLGFAWNQQRKIPHEALATVPFEQETGSIAHALVTGKGFSNPFLRDTGPTAWLTPVYPLLVAATFKIFGIFSLRSFFFLVFLNSIFSAAACVSIYRIGLRVSGIGVASAAAWLWAVFPSAVMMPFEWIWDTSVAAYLCAAVLLATLKLADSTDLRTRTRDWLAYGLLWGFTLMTNPSLGSALPFLLAWAAWRARKRELSPNSQSSPNSPNLSASLAKPAAALGLAILCCIPWTIRNYAVFHRLVPLRSNFPLELYIGNNENYGGTRARWPPPITKERETVRYFRLGETAFMDEELRKATTFIRAHPGKAVTLTAKRFVAFWAGVANPLDTFPEAELLVKILIVCAALSGLGALGGIIVLALRHSPYTIPLAVFPIVFPLIYYITHTSIRYRHPIEPIVLLLTAIAFHPLAQRLLARNPSAATSTPQPPTSSHP
jgi:Dolichyl-phosphate-mannose-protein mannosyltransferase